MSEFADATPAEAATPSGSTRPGSPAFVTTHWSVVLAAGRSDTTHASDALAKLCRTYWHPLYAYVRRRGYSPHDAEDLTQSFFQRLLVRNDVAAVHPARGRFRSYLLAAMKHFLSDEWDKARAQKRGGNRVIEMDSSVAERIHVEQADDTLTPEWLYDKRWAITVVEEVHRQLRQVYEQEGKHDLFDKLRFSLMAERSAVSYAELGAQMNLSEGAVKVAVHRLRQRYRKLLKAMIAETVATPAEVEEELAYLIQALSRGQP